LFLRVVSLSFFEINFVEEVFTQCRFSIAIWLSGWSMFALINLWADCGFKRGHYLSFLRMWQDFDKRLDVAVISIEFCVLRGDQEQLVVLGFNLQNIRLLVQYL